MSVFDDIEKKEQDFNQNVFDEMFGAKLSEFECRVWSTVNQTIENYEQHIQMLNSRINSLENQIKGSKIVIYNAPPYMVIQEEPKYEYEAKIQIGSYLTDRVDAPEYPGDTTVDVGVYK